MEKPARLDTAWTDDEIVLSDMTPDTDFVFARMTDETIRAVDPKPGETILDVACGRAIDATALSKTGATLYGIEASNTMIEKALEFMGPNRKVTIVRSLAENLAFADGVFDKVVCKGAMDHFADIKASMAEMARVTRPGGNIIIAIANFESLTCRLGRGLWTLRSKITGRPLPEKRFWEPPDDHNYKFDLPVLKALVAPYCRLDTLLGVSLLWGFPGWGALTRKMPKAVSAATLRYLDAAAGIFPSYSDVVIATCRKP